MSVVIENVDWTTYTRLLYTFRERRGIRLTYDRGDLEIATTAHERERESYLLGGFVNTLTEEQNIPMRAARCTTWRRRKKRRGLEADNSYWIQNEPQVRGHDPLDLRTAPPPDLAIEVDVTHSSLDRMTIYAALGVPEVWRLADGTLTFHALDAAGNYRETPRSIAFPFLAPAVVQTFRAMSPQQDDTTVVRAFRSWVRQQVASPGP